MKAWETNECFASTRHLTNYIFEERQHLFDNNYIDSIEKNTKHIEQFKTWLTSDKLINKIEKAFYDNEKTEIAERISWVEQILTSEKK